MTFPSKTTMSSGICFFFQAEDGIRDLVTGVQTCALPISSLTVPDVHLISLLPSLEGLIFPSKFYGAAAAGRPVAFIGPINGEIADELALSECEIGRASCRERV